MRCRPACRSERRSTCSSENDRGAEPLTLKRRHDKRPTKKPMLTPCASPPIALGGLERRRRVPPRRVGTRLGVPDLERAFCSSADEHGVAHFAVFAVHLLENDGMPGPVALVGGHVMFARPAAEPEFLDHIHV